jgi:hypothetical protein
MHPVIKTARNNRVIELVCRSVDNNPTPLDTMIGDSEAVIEVTRIKMMIRVKVLRYGMKNWPILP